MGREIITGTAVCAFCHKEFEYSVIKGGRVPKYCSYRCKHNRDREASKEKNYKSRGYRPMNVLPDVPEYKPDRLGKLLIELKAQGITYADYQKRQTLALLPPIRRNPTDELQPPRISKARYTADRE